MLQMHELEGDEVRAALKFDLTHEMLFVLIAPDDANPYSGIFLSTPEGLAFAGSAEDHNLDAADDEEEADGEPNEDNNLNLIADIDLEAILPLGAIPHARSPSMVSFISGEPTVFIEAGDRIFTVDIQSLKTEDVVPGHHRLPGICTVGISFWVTRLQSSTPLLVKGEALREHRRRHQCMILFLSAASFAFL